MIGINNNDNQRRLDYLRRQASTIQLPDPDPNADISASMKPMPGMSIVETSYAPASPLAHPPSPLPDHRPTMQDLVNHVQQARLRGSLGAILAGLVGGLAGDNAGVAAMKGFQNGASRQAEKEMSLYSSLRRFPK